MIKEESRFADSTVFEGMTSLRAVIEGARSGISDRRILRILYDRSRETAKAKELSYIRRMADILHFELSAVSSAEIDSLSTGNSHGGIIAECSPRTIPAIADTSLPADGFVVMIEGIEDPYNFGYALRTIYAAGADAVVLTPRNWMSAAGVVCRASAGASEMLPLSWGEPEEIAKAFKEKGYSIVAADKTDDAVSVYDTKISFPVLLVVGGEKRGISAAFREHCDKTVMLDYGREFRAALSAASASSIIAFEIFRHNRKKEQA